MASAPCHVIDWLHDAGRRSSTAGSWSGWSRAPTGTPRSSARRCWACAGYPGLHPQGRDRRQLYRLRASACSTAADRIYPQFATHNAHTVAAVLEHGRQPRAASSSSACTAWASALTKTSSRPSAGTRCRIYAPVGAHKDLLAYLVRRLLENGANSSFVHQIADRDVPLDELIADPVEPAAAASSRKPPSGDPAAAATLRAGAAELRRHRPHRPRRQLRRLERRSPMPPDQPRPRRPASAAPGRRRARRPQPGRPSRRRRARSTSPTPPTADARHRAAPSPARRLGRTPVGRARRHPRARRRPLRGQRGRTLRALRPARPARPWPTRSPKCARRSTSCATTRPRRADCWPSRRAAGPTGEANRCRSPARRLRRHQPWNFPLAIFTGQIAAALVAGNTRARQARRSRPR